MESTLRKELKELRRRMKILDRAIAGMEELAAENRQIGPNLLPRPVRLYRCVDRSSAHGPIRGASRAATLGENLR